MIAPPLWPYSAWKFDILTLTSDNESVAEVAISCPWLEGSEAPTPSRVGIVALQRVPLMLPYGAYAPPGVVGSTAPEIPGQASQQAVELQAAREQRADFMCVDIARTLGALGLNGGCIGLYGHRIRWCFRR